MRLVIQRVKEASVSIGGEVVSSIGKGLFILVGVENGDTEADMEWLAQKTVGMRIFDDENGVMNLNVTSVDGALLAVSQFTLTASTKKGNRVDHGGRPVHNKTNTLYEKYCARLAEIAGRPVQKGVFGADMQCALINDGPVTIIIDSKIKE